MKKAAAEAGGPGRVFGETGMLTRAQMAARCGVTVAEIKRRERVGLTVPATCNEKGWHLYSAEQVEQVRNCTTLSSKQKRLAEHESATYSGEEAAAVFVEIDSGRSLAECVKKLSLHPRVVERIAGARSQLESGVFISGETMAVINELPLDGTFPIKTSGELLDVLRACSSSRCKRCVKRAPVLCKSCAVEGRIPKAEEV